MDNSYLRYVTNTSQFQLYIYYIVVFISFLYLLNKYKKKPFLQYIILLFYSGFFSFIGKFIFNLYQIIRTLLAVYWINKTQPIYLNNKTFSVYFGFTIFTIVFFTSALINGDYLNIIFSQYSRYFIAFSLFFIFFKYRNDKKFKLNMSQLIYDILSIQIFLTCIKFLIIGVKESIVGSISSLGGAVATSLPIIGFMVIWVIKRGIIRHKDFILICGLVFIGFVSEKRAVLFVMPIVVLLFMYYIPKKMPSFKIIIITFLLIPSFFYFGVKLNYTLNPERSRWGSFDVKHIYSYTYKYMFGSEEQIERTGLYFGRGGATKLLYDKLLEGKLESKDLFGKGLRFIYTTSYEEFSNLGYGLYSLGSANGAFQGYISNGFLGIFTFLIISILIINKTKNNRLRNVILLVFFWEYFYYTGIIFRFPALIFLLLFMILFSPKTFKVNQNKLKKNIINKINA